MIIFAKNDKMRRLVIFDLDGTLLYTLEDLTNSVNFSLDLFGYETKTLEEITSFVGNGVDNWCFGCSNATFVLFCSNTNRFNRNLYRREIASPIVEHYMRDEYQEQNMDL